MSNRLNNGPANAAFTANGMVGSNFPLGFVAAKTDVRVFSLHTRPALATLIVCCSMASCMTVLSPSRTPPNSSMQHTPPSARTNAPASSCQSPPPSRVAATVSPADVVPERKSHDSSWQCRCGGSSVMSSSLPCKVAEEGNLKAPTCTHKQRVLTYARGVNTAYGKLSRHF
jgi:hypothetical protein